MKLVFNKILNEEDFNCYLSKVNVFKEVYPFYKVLGDDIYASNGRALRYFTFEVNDKVLIVMPFVIREIDYKLNDKVYYDVISPYGYSGPLYDQDLSRGYLLEFWKEVDAWYKANDIVSEFIRFSLNFNHQFYSGKLVGTLSNVNGVIISDEKQQWDSYKSKVRNNYRKSVSNDLRFEMYHDDVNSEHIVEFYKVYIETMKRIGASSEYFYSLEYFQNIVKLNQENHALAFVYKDDVLISVELIFVLGSYLYSYLGGTLADYFNYRPNDFLKISVINWAREKGFTNYVLGGGRVDGDNLYQYKKAFFPNDDDVMFYTGRKIVNLGVYKELVSLATKDGEEKVKVKISNKTFFPAYRRAT
ncbi:GNAT family N-acetyltransferase [Algibacter miyuki]|uniref:GNAT family N-acetyltransferase n=1 Tax=Algibacter miyuki TaxID=1306933 RepID=A0ABV5GYG2_9FLAO|nr:GNAT family N-acetyltransferase [Algibacter miyuki]MDN3667139.1 GNAT family N-acetyltransferase [Algibacter miyuki]